MCEICHNLVPLFVSRELPLARGGGSGSLIGGGSTTPVKPSALDRVRCWLGWVGLGFGHLQQQLDSQSLYHPTKPHISRRKRQPAAFASVGAVRSRLTYM